MVALFVRFWLCCELRGFFVGLLVDAVIVCFCWCCYVVCWVRFCVYFLMGVCVYILLSLVVWFDLIGYYANLVYCCVVILYCLVAVGCKLCLLVCCLVCVSCCGLLLAGVAGYDLLVCVDLLFCVLDELVWCG